MRQPLGALAFVSLYRFKLRLEHLEKVLLQRHKAIGAKLAINDASQRVRSIMPLLQETTDGSNHGKRVYSRLLNCD
jgi:hypothetical protein